MSATPILDLEQHPPQPKLSWWYIATCFAIGVAAGLLLVHAPPGLPRLNFLLLLPAIYLATAIHEAGHLAAGKVVGFRADGILLGGIRFSRSGDRWRFKFMPSLIFGGAVRPGSKTGKPSRAHFALMIAGGPIASLLLTGACTYALVAHGSGTSSWISTMFWASSLCILSLLPLRSAVNWSDGARLWMLLRRPAESRAWIALIALQAEETRGALPREWNPELVALAFNVQTDWEAYSYRQYLDFCRFIDLQNDTEALDCLERALAHSGKDGKKLRRAYYLEAAAVSAAKRKNASRARTWRSRALALGKPASIDGTEAEIALCEGRYQDALQHLEAARDYFEKKKLDSGLARFAKEYLAKREDECRAYLAGDQPRPSSSVTVL